jgi:hypothetical protein
MINADDCTGHNKQVKSRQLWGDGVYTDDSDLVAVLMHAGYYAANTAANPPQVRGLRCAAQRVGEGVGHVACAAGSGRLPRRWC